MNRTIALRVFEKLRQVPAELYLPEDCLFHEVVMDLTYPVSRENFKGELRAMTDKGWIEKQDDDFDWPKWRLTETGLAKARELLP